MPIPPIAYNETVTETWLNLVGAAVDASTTAIAALPPVGVTVYAATLADVLNTVVETTVLSFVIPASTMADGDVIFVWLASRNKNDKGSPGMVTVKVNVGAGAQVQVADPTWTNFAAEYQAIGAAVVLMRVGTDVWVGDPGLGAIPLVSSVSLGPYAQGITVVPGITTPTNFTSANTVSLKVTLDAADPTFYLKPQKACIWHVRHP